MWNNNVTSPRNLPVTQVIEPALPQHAPTDLPVVPPNLSFAEGTALDTARQMLTQAPALRAWCDQAFDGVNAGQVLADVITLMFHQHADNGHPSGTTLEARDTVLARLAPRLSLTGKAALKQSLAADAAPQTAPNAFAKLFAERDRWYLEALVCREDGQACLLSGDYEQAAIHFKRAANCFAHVPEQTTRVADCARRAADAYGKANLFAMAVRQWEEASTLELALALALHALANPQPSDMLACQAAFMRATYDMVAAAALYRTMQRPGLALALDRYTAKAFMFLAMFPQAAERYTQMGDTWTDIATAFHQAGDTARAEAAAQQARLAFRAAARAHWAGHSYAAAGEALVKALDFVEAGEVFSKDGRHDSASQCYLWAAQRSEADARMHQRAQRPELANASFQLALANYALAATELQKAAYVYGHVHQHGLAAACLVKSSAALRLSMRTQLPPATP